jgi:hypothetical protein
MTMSGYGKSLGHPRRWMAQLTGRCLSLLDSKYLLGKLPVLVCHFYYKETGLRGVFRHVETFFTLTRKLCDAPSGYSEN